MTSLTEIDLASYRAGYLAAIQDAAQACLATNGDVYTARDIATRIENLRESA